MHCLPNPIQKLKRDQDENKRPLFKSISIELICKACKAKNSEATKCVHKLDMLPSWKSEARQEKVRRIMETVPELYMREALGVATSERFGVFTSNQLSTLGELISVGSKRTQIARDDTIFVTVDPTGGGSSKLAIISAMCHEGKFTLVGTMKFFLPTCMQTALRMSSGQSP